MLMAAVGYAAFFQALTTSNIPLFFSIGIAGGVGARLSSDELVRDADAAMYSARSAPSTSSRSPARTVPPREIR